MIPPELHAVVHWTHVDHRVARYAKTTVAAFLSAARRRTLRYRPPSNGPQGDVVAFASTRHVMRCSTKSRNLTCSIASRIPHDSYEITVTMPLLSCVQGHPIDEDPDPSLEHLRIFVALTSVSGIPMEPDPDGLLEFARADGRGSALVERVNEASADMMALWASEDRTTPRSIKAELPLLDRPGRFSRIDEPLASGGIRRIQQERTRAAIEHVRSTLPAAAVLCKDGPTHFCIRPHSMEPPGSVPDPMETMRRMADVHSRMGSTR